MAPAETSHTLTSPLYTYVHPHTAQRTHLVGTVHVGEPAYYQALREVVEGHTRNGAAVHYEGVLRATDEELRAASPIVRYKALRLRAVSDALCDLIDLPNLVLQEDALPPADTWESHDMTELEVAQRTSMLAVYGARKALRLWRSSLRSLSPAEQRAHWIDALQQPFDEPVSGSWIDNQRNNRDHVRLTRRNTIALAAAGRHWADRPTTDLVLIWGTGHLPGLRRGLHARGFVKESETSLTAIHP